MLPKNDGDLCVKKVSGTLIWKKRFLTPFPKLRVQLEKGGEKKMVEFALNEPVIFSGKKIVLSAVTPTSHSDKTISNGEYSFSFEVTSL